MEEVVVELLLEVVVEVGVGLQQQVLQVWVVVEQLLQQQVPSSSQGQLHHLQLENQYS